MLEGTPADALVQSRVDRREPKEDGDEYFGSARKPMPAPDFEATAAVVLPPSVTEAADDAAPALDEATIKAMKVAELKDALSARGLDTDGKKAQLAARLLKAVAAAVAPVETPAAEEEAPAIVLPPSVVEVAAPAVEEAAPALDVDLAQGGRPRRARGARHRAGEAQGADAGAAQGRDRGARRRGGGRRARRSRWRRRR